MLRQKRENTYWSTINNTAKVAISPMIIGPNNRHLWKYTPEFSSATATALLIKRGEETIDASLRVSKIAAGGYKYEK